MHDFVNDADVKKNGSTAILATLFHHLDYILGGHPVKEKAWAQICRSEEISKLSLPTKSSKAESSEQMQKWLGKIYITRKQRNSLASEKIQKYISQLQLKALTN